jgi:hypothetical protein
VTCGAAQVTPFELDILTAIRQSPLAKDRLKEMLEARNAAGAVAGMGNGQGAHGIPPLDQPPVAPLVGGHRTCIMKGM